MNQIKLVDWKMKCCLTETHRSGLAAGYSKALHCNMYGNPGVANATVWSQSVALDRSLSNQWGSGRLGLWRECWRTHSTIVYFIFLDVLIRCGSFGTAYAKSSWGMWCIRVRFAYILCQTSAAKKMKTSQVPMHFQPLLLVHSEFSSCHWLATSVEVNSESSGRLWFDACKLDAILKCSLGNLFMKCRKMEWITQHK